MVRTLIFKPDKEVTSLVDDFSKEGKKDVVWMHLYPDEDKVIDTIIEEMGQDEEFQEDLLEEQRPRLTNFKNFSVVVFAAPLLEGLLQLSFIISKRKIISVSNIRSETIDKLMTEYEHSEAYVTPSKILSDVLGELVEEIIKTIFVPEFKDVESRP
ncbi:MAG: hypothetical protein J7K68_05640 [Candidatus Diapherotrites archaeon]|nr:hypothetical protein [Candidatus Diapherotrites archaeon]